jgi:hypothetical protein
MGYLLRLGVSSFTNSLTLTPRAFAKRRMVDSRGSYIPVSILAMVTKVTFDRFAKAR